MPRPSGPRDPRPDLQKSLRQREREALGKGLAQAAEHTDIPDIHLHTGGTWPPCTIHSPPFLTTCFLPSYSSEHGHDDGSSIDRLLEELNATFSYVSEFLKKVPEQARTKSIFWSRMENYKKDQDVYLKGEEPGKFYMILTGVCWCGAQAGRGWFPGTKGQVPRQEGAGAQAGRDACPGRKGRVPRQEGAGTQAGRGGCLGRKGRVPRQFSGLGSVTHQRLHKR